MSTTLHLLTKPEDPLAEKIIAQQIQLPDRAVEVVDLTQPELDYDIVLEKIFTADSITVW
jgi:hypothetical protein